ncbi:MAG: CDP-glycerol glycerophosphotransferase family protein [Eubacterium sp.]|nr:CDP-glycerol glycerophosphotransferase family protein [Eubacterium sp.]
MINIKSLAYPLLQKGRYAKLISLFNKAKGQPLEPQKIVMLATSKGKLGGNLLAIKDYIEKHQLPYTVTAYTEDTLPELGALAQALATAKYVMVDDYEPMVYPLSLREGQHLVQVWHAMGAFKRFGYARATAEQGSITHKNYTEAIVSSPELCKIYAESFGIRQDRIKPVGTPRTDAFFDSAHTQAVKARLYAAYPALQGKKVCLFAPTFRGENVHDGYYPEQFIDLAALAQELGEDWTVVLKLHPFVKNRPAVPASVLDLSAEREINDLLLLTDVLVTDYSSVIFENAVIGNAAVLYAPDLAEYTDARGFYFPYSDYACGEVVTDAAQLAAAVRAARKDDARMLAFQQRFVPLCDGHACERFVKEILEEH